MSQVGPDDALSNLSQWYSFATKLGSPLWLQDPRTDFWGMIFFSLAAVASFFWFVWPYRNVVIAWPRRRQDFIQPPRQIPKDTEPHFAPPPEAEKILIGSVSFQDLGDMMIKLSQEILTFVTHVQGRYTDHQIANEFFSKFIRRFFWLYREAYKRGLRNSLFERMHEDLRGEIFDAGHIRNVAKELERFGHDVRIRSY